ncbi:MAG: heme-copper oxidase subunit III [bacterium]|nr:heme-copper oxidase subunit III [bacterium]
MGMAIFLVSISMLFLGALVGYVVIRSRSGVWPPVGAPALPRGLIVSTLLLFGCSVSIQRALSRIRAGDEAGLLRALQLTVGIAVLFLVAQGWSWWVFFHSATFASHLYGFTFYMLTGLHALHILGGLVSLGVVMYFAVRSAYSWAHYPGVRMCAIYWHYLAVVWVVLYVVLLVES